MVALAKIKGLIIDSHFAVDSPNSSAVGLRFFSGFRVSTFSSYTAQRLHSTECARPNQRPQASLSRLDTYSRVQDMIYILSGQRRLHRLSGI